MTETERLLERQARWQRERKSLSWSEKIRMAERVRETIERLRPGGRAGGEGQPQ